MKRSQSVFVPVRGLRYHLRSWGPADAPMLFMLHGWKHSSAVFQFTVDALKQDWRVLAPDWRGTGATEWAQTSYWFQEFLADLEALLDHFSPHAPVNLVGHSFGASVACVYAGARPGRVARLLDIDGLGPHEWKPEGAPSRYVRLIELMNKAPRQRVYGSMAELEQYLQKEYPSVSAGRVAFLAREWSRLDAQDRVELRSDPVQNSNFSMRFSNRLDDAMACWRAMAAPVMMVIARQGSAVKRATDLNEGRLEQRLANLRHARTVWLDNTGHMAHLEHPETLARLIEEFFPHTHPVSHEPSVQLAI